VKSHQAHGVGADVRLADSAGDALLGAIADDPDHWAERDPEQQTGPGMQVLAKASSLMR